jgi:hypothetical protein
MAGVCPHVTVGVCCERCALRFSHFTCLIILTEVISQLRLASTATKRLLALSVRSSITSILSTGIKVQILPAKEEMSPRMRKRSIHTPLSKPRGLVLDSGAGPPTTREPFDA